MDRYHGPSPVIKEAVPAVNDDLYNVFSLKAGKQADMLKKFIENEVDRLFDTIWPRESEPSQGDDRREQP